MCLGDDGEEFKVKKSSYSKKIKKQMNKEKMGRDKFENGKKAKVLGDMLTRPVVKEEITIVTNSLLLLIFNMCSTVQFSYIMFSLNPSYKKK